MNMNRIFAIIASVLLVSSPAAMAGTGFTGSIATSKTVSSADIYMAGRPATLDEWGTTMPAEDEYTGLVIDCRGLPLKPVMSPVIRDMAGRPIYGHKNLDYDKVTHKGMVGYSRDMYAVARAGDRPLVIRAAGVMNHGGDVVVSLADANRIIIENARYGFLDKTNVVFVRGPLHQAIF